MKKEILNAKVKKLKGILIQMESVLISYSGGADSSFLLKIAVDVLGQDCVLAVTARSQIYPEPESIQARRLAGSLRARHLYIDTGVMGKRQFQVNSPSRCYYCKKELFGCLSKIAKDRAIRYIADGTNLDDRRDFRPGMKALTEFGVRSPLKEAGMTKEDIRTISKEMRLPTWDKPAMTCLATRIPYGEPITSQRLKVVEKAEDFLKRLGFRQVRLRHYGAIARIELLPHDIKRLNKKSIRDRITSKLKTLGFTYVTLDLEGYRSGSMDEVLGK